uniref:RNase H type-1 domain-containing protein n=1 Tax=Cannabis sativa TaxID=3483 RepID=A0A803QIM4_CANSA
MPCSFAREFEECGKHNAPILRSRPPVATSWTPPPQGLLKLNTDAAISKNHPSAGLGGVICNSDGKVVALLLLLTQLAEMRPSLKQCLSFFCFIGAPKITFPFTRLKLTTRPSSMLLWPPRKTFLCSEISSGCFISFSQRHYHACQVLY